MKNNFLPCLFILFLLFSCNSSDSKKEHLNNRVSLSDFQKYDSLIFAVDRLDTLTLEERIKFFEEDGRIIQYFDEEWKHIAITEASFISTVKHLEEDLFIVRDYYITGENQMTGIYKALYPEVDWTMINEWDTQNAEARKVGKCVWYSNGKMSFLESYSYFNFKKGLGTTDRQEFNAPPKSRPVKVLIKKDTAPEH